MSEASSPGPGAVPLTDDERAAIDAIWDQRLTATHYDLLGVPFDADRRVVREAYFTLSKRFHPDVFYRRELGDYRQRLDEVFRMLTRAYDVLGNAKQRAGYDLHLANLHPSRSPPGSPSMPPPAAPKPAPPPVVTAPTPPRVASAIMPEGAVVPPPMRPATLPSVPPPSAPASSQPIDPAVRQRALESMRRRLEAVVPGAPRPSNPAPPPASTPPGAMFAAPPPRSAPDDREARLARFLADGEEAQKKGDFSAALESFRNAFSISQNDPAIKARVDAVDQLVKAQRTGGYIEKAREAMRDGKAEIAASFWEKAWEGRPTDATLLVNAAEVLAKHSNNRGKAKELAQRALQIDPKSVKAQVVLAQVFTAGGLKASARTAIEAIERLEPNNPALKELREKLGPPSLAEQLGRWGR